MTRTHTEGRRRSRGGLVTLGTVVGLLVAMGVTLLGTGAFSHNIASFDGTVWLWSNQKGEAARVNGVTGRVDTRYKISDGQGRSMQVTQNDKYVILRDLSTGKISVLDLSNLQVGATTQTTPGLGVTVALGSDAAFIVDAVQGAVRQLDPATLAPVGQPLSFPPGISGGEFDSDGKLWVLVPSEGTAVAVKPAKVDRQVLAAAKTTKSTAPGARGPGDPTIAKTLAVADPSHDLTLSVLDSGVAVLDKTATTLITVRGDEQHSIRLALDGPGALPPRTVGPDVPVTVTDARHVYVVADGKVVDFPVPGASPKLQACTAWSGQFYCPDDATGTVYVLDRAGKLTNTVNVPANGVPLQLEVREEHLFINAPGSANARVVDDHHKIKVVDKYVNDVLGGDPPPAPPPPPPPPPPPVGPPGAPANVTATAGNAQAHVSWATAPANGAAIIKYVVEGDGKAHEVGANQRSIDVTGLTNGQTYTFTVYAVNAKGNGPKRAANPVVPTSDVPDAPASVTAKEAPDGTVAVSWPAANGQGHKVVRYDVTAISAEGQEQAGSSDGTSFTVPAGKLTYGTQYGFTVTAVNDKGASSQPSPVSNSVVPYTVPGKPTVTATTITDAKGAINVTWTAAADNGRPVTKYVVVANSVTQEVTGRSAKITGLANGATVTVKVHAVNAAGNGPDGTTTAKTIEEPTVKIAGASATQTAVTVQFTVDLGNATTSSCSLTMAGKAAVSGPCNSITAKDLLPSTSYNYTVTVTTPAGSATATGTQATDAVTGVAYCTTTSSDPAYKAWCTTGDNALELQTNPAKLHATQVGRTTHGTTYKAFCYTTGDQVYAYVYNNDKDTNIWVKIEANGGQYYTPLAWFNVDGNNSVYTGALPRC